MRSNRRVMARSYDLAERGYNRDALLGRGARDSMPPVETTQATRVTDRESLTAPLSGQPGQAPQPAPPGPRSRIPVPLIKWAAVLLSATLILLIPVPNGITAQS